MQELNMQVLEEIQVMRHLFESIAVTNFSPSYSAEICDGTSKVSFSPLLLSILHLKSHHVEMPFVENNDIP
jgi:hypothetical protein